MTTAELNTAIKLRYQSIRRACPRLPQVWALHIACLQVSDLLARPHCTGLESQLADYDERKLEAGQ